MFNVSIVETRSIIRAIHDAHGFDLSGYAMTSLRFRISQILMDHNFHYPEALIERILEDPDFLDTFIQKIAVGSPDPFRDPDCWIELRDRLIPGLLRKFDTFDILVPSSVTGDELFSMAMLLEENGWSKRIRLSGTCLNKPIADGIREGLLSQVRYKAGVDNYRIFNPGSQLERHLFRNEGKLYKSPALINRIELSIKKPTAISLSVRNKLILFRNRLLFVNQAMKNRILTGMVRQMDPGNYLILGTRESLKGTGMENELQTVSSDLNIYAKGSNE